MPLFDRYIGIDYSGAETAESSLSGLRVYLATDSNEPREELPPPSPRKYWTRRALAHWLCTELSKEIPTIVGIDHGFSFPIAYFDKYALPHDWAAFLDDFQKHWPTDHPGNEVRVLIATDVLSEGQNLQDCHVIVNYDLPWAIIRLIQRAGRVDRIGQKADTIYCHSFMPADGIERIINLRRRVRQRLRENSEVVGSDELFFEDDANDQRVVDLYNEMSGILEETDTEVDLASYAYQIWKNAIDQNPKLQKLVAELPEVVYSTKPHTPTAEEPSGALVYMRTSEGNDSLAWIDGAGKSVTQSQLAILR
ncbi:MAG TPA: C-terminal helicase domain-containing protein, partial [Terriglobales bacterium]|nr:C-terminal helicase domain-containing protein [Terriglobales bacterium]